MPRLHPLLVRVDGEASCIRVPSPEWVGRKASRGDLRVRRGRWDRLWKATP